MSHSEAVAIVKFHQNMLSEIDEYTPEYIADLQDPNGPHNGIQFSQALEIVLKGAVQDGQGYPRAS